ncbi:MAG: SUMF1/EgtB/PvdO family nonheme iron enzyme [Planctomycetota bacterium]|jgi:formylglycine-generating enzyme required for sulfatase activity
MRTEQKASNIKKAVSCSWQILGLTYLSILAGCHTSSQSVEGEIPVDKEYVNTVGMKMVRIGPGSFRMGQERQADGKSITLTYGDRHFMGGELDEQPLHKVLITKPFYMSVTEVTNAQYEQFDPDHRSLRAGQGLSSEDDEAVVFVSWHDAMNFCKWLSKKEQRPHRLPTEAEWEYACRAGTTTRFNTGNDLPEVYQKAQKHKSRPEKVPTRVGLTPPNAWRLYDMHGNVEEWCYDWYGPYEAGVQKDPVGRKSGLWKVVRGGSHNVYLKSLRSANRMSTLAKDKHWLIGFRVVQAQLPTTEPLPTEEPPLNARNIRQKPYDWRKGPDMTKPYFEGPIPFVRKPKNPESVPFFFHNHVPSITWCDNGDLLAAWFSCARERGRELGIVASRFRRATGEWDEASAFLNARDRNMHGTALYNDGTGRIFHLNGLGTDGWWSKLALVQRVSTDNGATWSYPKIVDPDHGRYIPHMGISKTREGFLIFPADAPGGTGLYMSRDAGRTWQMVTNNVTGGNIRGTHAAAVQLTDGSIMAFGRGKPIDDRMPMSLSKDTGKTWTYSAAEFPPVSGGQRTVLLRLREGPILHVSFTDTADYESVILDKPRPRTLSQIGIPVKDAAGKERRIYGMFAAVTFDEGKTWPLKKLLTAGGPSRKLNGQAWTQDFIMDDTHAEPLGYLAITQSPDNIIHLISSGLHYRFNLAWLKKPMPTEKEN